MMFVHLGRGGHHVMRTSICAKRFEGGSALTQKMPNGNTEMISRIAIHETAKARH